MKRRHIARAIGLIPNGIARGKSDWSRIADPARPSACHSNGQTNGFLHQEDNMFDVSDRAGTATSGDF